MDDKVNHTCPLCLNTGNNGDLNGQASPDVELFGDASGWVVAESTRLMSGPSNHTSVLYLQAVAVARCLILPRGKIDIRAVGRLVPAGPHALMGQQDSICGSIRTVLPVPAGPHALMGQPCVDGGRSAIDAGNHPGRGIPAMIPCNPYRPLRHRNRRANHRIDPWTGLVPSMRSTGASPTFIHGAGLWPSPASQFDSTGGRARGNPATKRSTGLFVCGTVWPRFPAGLAPCLTKPGYAYSAAPSAGAAPQAAMVE